MKPRDRTLLNQLSRWADGNGISLHGMERKLRSRGEDLPAELAEIHTAVVSCQASIQSLSTKLVALYGADHTLRDSGWDEPLAATEISQLLSLNRRLSAIAPLLKSVATEVSPRLAAKVADPNDPMYDYEIEARLAFIMREEDPDYDEDNDNILTTRNETLKHLRPDESENFAETIGPKGLQAEPHCWRFHDLYDHEYGADSPSLSFHDCLRISKVLVDVKVCQQYDFDVLSTHAKTTG